MRRILIAAAALALTVAGAASGAGASEPEKKSVGDSFIDISPIPMPIIVEGRLINYVLVHVRLNVNPNLDAAKLRDKEPYLRDALVRSAHRSPLTDKTDYYRVDEALLKAAIARDVAPLIGARNITSVQITKQMSSQRTGLPTPKT
jgi:flagellar basal body-associated protein FliL